MTKTQYIEYLKSIQLERDAKLGFVDSQSKKEIIKVLNELKKKKTVKTFKAFILSWLRFNGLIVSYRQQDDSFYIKLDINNLY